ncbi:DUF202 domain-containing protein [Kribbella sp. NPDC003505]|uniref:DUF202 domain-containing protein n=1 Tax=Kribbella sp. NPDC003505 TaxID=3154448 RepID=UPI0033A1A58B
MSTPDPGRQPERTLLAWRRTALGLIANGVLLLASGHGSSEVRTGLGIVVLVLALGCWAAASAVYRRSEGGAVHALGHQNILRIAAGLVLVVGLFDLYAVITR